MFAKPWPPSLILLRLRRKIWFLLSNPAKLAYNIQVKSIPSTINHFQSKANYERMSYSLLGKQNKKTFNEITNFNCIIKSCIYNIFGPTLMIYICLPQ